MKIGIFDSGIGGLTIAQQLKKSFPDHAIITAHDRKNVPYGTKSPALIARLTDHAIQPLLEEQCCIIIIACNTATAVAIDFLRKKYPDTLFIGLEPMLKPAAKLTKTNVVALCATPATLASNYYQMRKKLYPQMKIIEPDCSQWATMIEYDQMNTKIIHQTIQHALEQNADVIILGCTHYHWIEDDIQQLVGKSVQVIQPSDAISRRVAELLARIDSPDLDNQ
jgi:glutamate racemase